MKTLHWLVALPLSGCIPGTSEPPAAEPASSPPTAVSPRTIPATASAIPVAADELPGEYRVAGVDGQDIDQPSAITASITANRIHIVAGCLNFAWRYTLDAGRLEAIRIAVEGCARGPTQAENAVVAAFDAATFVERTPANGVQLRGGDRSVTLFAQ